jgi:hypothetical protein
MPLGEQRDDTLHRGAGMDLLQTTVYRPIDWLLPLSRQVEGNPFHVRLAAVATGPGHARLTVPGFYKGDGVWCVRFMPTSPGEWRLLSISAAPELAGRQAIVQADPNMRPEVHGVLRVEAAHPLHFRYDDGTPYFLMGYEIDWLWALDQGESETRRIDRLLDMVGAAGFNHIMVNSYAHDTSWCPGKTRPNDFGPAKLRPWPGSAEKPDHTRLVPAYFEHYDRMMWALWERGMVAHIYLKVYNKHVVWPEKYSSEEELFFDYFVARYQAFPNLVWDFSKECYHEADKQYVAARLARIRQLDAYQHLTTVHDDWYFAYNEPTKRFLDFFTDQNHHELYHTVIEQRHRGMGPIVNAEYGYEHGPAGMADATYPVVQSPLTVLARTCEVLMAGGYPVYYYTNHAWDVVEWDEAPAGLQAYKRLYAFFTAFAWQWMVPRPDLGQSGARCLTNELDEIVLFSADGRGYLVAHSAWDGTSWAGFWLNIWTGERCEVRMERLVSGRRHPLRAPWTDTPGFLYLQKES